ncbi:MAG: glycosyltransferase family 2 protein [Actinomycetota bacterium]|nr:glycosyltransferase family 2 protein [Actinomycetota bacterium]
MLSVVLPVYDEIDTLPELYRRLCEALSGHDFELLFVDDRSRDGSWELLRQLARKDMRVKAIRLSRNFGHQVAITAGMDNARGDAVVVMDADLQDPPELIPALLEKSREGYEVVYAVRAVRAGERRVKRWTATGFYWLFRRLTDIAMPADAGDFRLYSKRAVNALRSMPEHSRFLRGMSSWIGFEQIGIPYVRDARFAGSTKYSLSHMVRLSLDAVFSFSTVPLRLVRRLGIAVVLLCGCFFAYVLYARLVDNTAIHGFTSVIALVFMMGGVQLFTIGIVGEYLARVFEEAKARPLYFVDEVTAGRSSTSDSLACGTKTATDRR